ncbi:hypothetical protein GUJ93_ZPchr0015g6960 [Zizania palustris]|uniref:Uncharacterized protein n=1 Tax=Zizania palustris TaxID=103762 RepID=A0A8J5T8W9_ZIZPA|nr:hypothetical protein GUJ93_ZPchr0015g6960 [Zizania palustris]
MTSFWDVCTQNLACVSFLDIKVLEATKGLHHQWAIFEALKLDTRPRFSIPRDSLEKILPEIASEVLTFVKEKEKRVGVSSSSLEYVDWFGGDEGSTEVLSLPSEFVDWSNAEQEPIVAESSRQRLHTWAELQEEQRPRGLRRRGSGPRLRLRRRFMLLRSHAE